MSSGILRRRFILEASVRCGGDTKRARGLFGRRGRRKRSTASSVPSMHVFDRKHKLMQKDRSNRSANAHEYDYLRDYVAEQLTDRLQDICRDFPIALDLGCGAGHVAKHLDTLGGVERLVQMDMSNEAMNRCMSSNTSCVVDGRRDVHVVGDEEFVPLREESVDLVISSMSLHWVNDLPGTFAQVYRALKPDGVFLGAMLGGDTLNELRSSFVAAEQERHGGVSQHVSPLVQVSDVGTLLQSAGFNLPCVDTETVHVGYADSLAVWEHLQGMGDTNVGVGRLKQVSMDTMLASAAVYQTSYYVNDSTKTPTKSALDMEGSDAFDADGYLPATFQIVYMIGWKPAPTQQRPDLPGSATRSLTELGTNAPL